MATLSEILRLRAGLMPLAAEVTPPPEQPIPAPAVLPEPFRPATTGPVRLIGPFEREIRRQIGNLRRDIDTGAVTPAQALAKTTELNARLGPFIGLTRRELSSQLRAVLVLLPSSPAVLAAQQVIGAGEAAAQEAPRAPAVSAPPPPPPSTPLQALQQEVETFKLRILQRLIDFATATSELNRIVRTAISTLTDSAQRAEIIAAARGAFNLFPRSRAALSVQAILFPPEFSAPPL